MALRPVRATAPGSVRVTSDRSGPAGRWLTSSAARGTSCTGRCGSPPRETRSSRTGCRRRPRCGTLYSTPGFSLPYGTFAVPPRPLGVTICVRRADGRGRTGSCSSLRCPACVAVPEGAVPLRVGCGRRDRRANPSPASVVASTGRGPHPQLLRHQPFQQVHHELLNGSRRHEKRRLSTTIGSAVRDDFRSDLEMPSRHVLGLGDAEGVPVDRGSAARRHPLALVGNRAECDSDRVSHPAYRQLAVPKWDQRRIVPDAGSGSRSRDAEPRRGSQRT